MIKIDETKLGDKAYWDILFSTPEDKFKKRKKQSKYDLMKESYDKAPEHIRLDKEWVLHAILKNHLHIFSVDDRLKDENFCKEYVEKDDYPSLYGMPLIYQEKFIDLAMKKYSYNLSNLFFNKELAHLLTKENILSMFHKEIMSKVILIIKY